MPEIVKRFVLRKFWGAPVNKKSPCSTLLENCIQNLFWTAGSAQNRKPALSCVFWLGHFLRSKISFKSSFLIKWCIIKVLIFFLEHFGQNLKNFNKFSSTAVVCTVQYLCTWCALCSSYIPGVHYTIAIYLVYTSHQPGSWSIRQVPEFNLAAAWFQSGSCKISFWQL